MNTDEARQRIRKACEDSTAELRGERKPRSEFGTERKEQARVIAWLEQRGVICFHPANAGARNPAVARSQGIRAGVPDIIIVTPPPVGGYRAAAIEMKALAGGAVSMAQLEWIDKLRACGWAAKVCAGAVEAIPWLEDELGYGRAL